MIFVVFEIVQIGIIGLLNTPLAKMFEVLYLPRLALDNDKRGMNVQKILFVCCPLKRISWFMLIQQSCDSGTITVSYKTNKLESCAPIVCQILVLYHVPADWLWLTVLLIAISCPIFNLVFNVSCKHSPLLLTIILSFNTQMNNN